LENTLTLTGYIAALILCRATGIDGYIATDTYSIHSYRHLQYT